VLGVLAPLAGSRGSHDRAGPKGNAATISLVRSSLVLVLVLVLLVATLASREASAQRCPAAPQDFRPSVQLVLGDTLLARNELVALILLRQQHCTTSRAPAPRISPSSLRATIVEGPLAGRSLAITPRAERLSIALPTAGTHTIRVESLAFASLVPATVRVHVMDPQRARPARLALERSPLDITASSSVTSLALTHESGARTTLFGPRFARGRTTPGVLLEPGSYAVTSVVGGITRSSRIAVVPSRAPIPVEFAGGSLRVDIDLLPDYQRRYSLVVTAADGQQERRPLQFPGTLLGLDLAPGPVTVSVESTRTQQPANREPAWTVHHREVLQIQRQTAHVFEWSLPAILGGQGSARRSWRALASLPGVVRAVPSGDVTSVPRAFASVGDALLLLTDGIAERRADRWTALSMPTGWAVPSTTASVAAIASDTYAWVAQSLIVGYRTPSGITGEALPIATGGARSVCSSEAIAATGPDALVVVGRCPDLEGSGRPRGFMATRDAVRWTMRTESLAPLLSVATIGDRAIAVGHDGLVATLRGSVLETRSIGSMVLRRVRAGRSRVVIEVASQGLIEYNEAAGSYATLATLDPSRFGTPQTEHCFVGDSLLILYKRRPGEPSSTLHLDDGASQFDLSTRATNAVALACASSEAWLLDATASGTHTLVRVVVPPRPGAR